MTTGSLHTRNVKATALFKLEHYFSPKDDKMHNDSQLFFLCLFSPQPIFRTYDLLNSQKHTTWDTKLIPPSFCALASCSAQSVLLH